ncbi:MAG: hypothetical protein FWB77_00030 [Treponema sp.]|nr:hypothetical protein [Treponema sp.]
MILRPYLIFLIVVLFSLQNLFAGETDEETEEQTVITESESAESPAAAPSVITAVELEAYLGAEFSRGNLNTGRISVIAGIELIDMIYIRTGFMFGQSIMGTDLNAFLNTKISPFTHKYLSPLGFSFSYIYNGYTKYDVHTNTILPMVFYTTDMAGVSVGLSLRFTSFFGEAPLFESVLTFYGYFNFIRRETFVMGIGAGTYNDFIARNMAAIWLNINADIRINKILTVYNEIEWMQSGMDGLTATYYGVAWRGGVKFKW